MKKNVIRGITTLFTIILTASLGRIQYGNHTETWYDLDMSKVVANAQAAGIPCEYSVRADGVKCFGEWVIVASHPSVTRYTFVETSLGTGIVLDRHTCSDTELYDIATDWKGE